MGSCGVEVVRLSVLERILGWRSVLWGIMRLVIGGLCIVSGRGEEEGFFGLVCGVVVLPNIYSFSFFQSFVWLCSCHAHSLSVSQYQTRIRNVPDHV